MHDLAPDLDLATLLHRAHPDRGVSTAGDWRDDAACRTADPAWFDPLDESEIPRMRGQVQALPRIARALRVCRTCPVRARCAAEADRYGYTGVWGGEYRRRRDAIRRRQTRKEAA